MKRIARVLGIVIVLLVAIVIALPFLVNANQFRPTLEARLTQALGRQVNIGDLKISLFSGGVAASDLSIADDPAFSKAPFLRAQSLNVGVEMLPLILSRKLNVTGIAIGQPQIDLIQNPAGVWNFSSIGVKTAGSPGAAPAAPAATTPAPPKPAGEPSSGSATAPGAALSVASLTITDGRVTMTKTGTKSKPVVLDKLNIEVHNFSANSSFPFTLAADLSGGGTLKLDGSAGPVGVGNAAATPFNAKLTAQHIDLIASGLLDPSFGIAGVTSIDGSAESAGGVIGVKGKLKGENLAFVKGGQPAKQPVEVDFDDQHNLAKQSGELRSMAIHLGSAIANLSGTYNLAAEPPSVNLKLSGSKMPLTELAGFLPALNIALPAGASIDQGTADVNLACAGPLDNLVTTGKLAAANTRLANYDFASKLQTLHEFSGIKAQPHTLIQTLATNVKNDRNGTALDDMQMQIASIGAVAGAGTISPTHVLDFKMRASLGGNALAGIGGKTGLPFTIQGTSENPSIKPDVKGLVSGQIKDLTGAKSAKDAATGLIKGLFGGQKKQQ